MQKNCSIPVVRSLKYNCKGVHFLVKLWVSEGLNSSKKFFAFSKKIFAKYFRAAAVAGYTLVAAINMF